MPFQHCSNSKSASKNDEGKDASSLKNQVAFEGTKVTVNYEQINMAQRVFKNMDYNFSVISNSDGTKTGSALFLENITQDDAQKMLLEEKEIKSCSREPFKHKKNDKKEQNPKQNYKKIVLLQELLRD